MTVTEYLERICTQSGIDVSQLPDRLLSTYLSAISEKLGIMKDNGTLGEFLAAFTEQYGAGHSDGYDKGYAEGWDMGWQPGYDQGRSEGEAIGRSEGYESGKADGLTEGIEQGRAEGITEGIEQGIEQGIAQGKQAERTAHWNVMQNNGGTQNYYLAFAYGRFTDDNYNPIHPIKCSGASTAGLQMFYSSPITDTKVEIYANSTDLQQAFNTATYLVTIRKLHVHETTKYTNTFNGANSLENVEFEGVIGRSIDFKSCTKLSVASAKNICVHLADYSGTTSEYLYDVLFTSTTLALLEAEGNTAPHGGSWIDYIASKGWNT